MSGPEMLVRALCNMMGVDITKLAPQVMDTMTKIQAAEQRLAAIEETCKNSASALGRIEEKLERLSYGKRADTIPSELGRDHVSYTDYSE